MKKENRTRNIPVRVWLSEKENEELERKARIAGLPKSSVIRILLKGYEPREQPDERFYETMRQFYAIGNNLNQLARKANTLGWVDSKALADLSERLAKFQLEIEQAFLLPAKSELKWK